MSRSFRPIHLGFILVAAIIGYATEWVPYYISAVSGQELHVLGSIEPYSVPCNDAPRGPLACRAAYRLPASLLGTPSQPVSLGLGIILFETEAFCTATGESIPLLTPSDKSGQSTDAPNTYQTLHGPARFCSGDLVIKAWAPPLYRRAGHVEAPLVLGLPERVREVKVLIEFFRAGFMHILLAVFLAIGFFDNRLVRAAGRDEAQASRQSTIDRFAPVWTAYLFLVSGFLNTLFPMGVGPWLGNKALHVVEWIGVPGTLLHRALAVRPGAPRWLHAVLAPVPRLGLSPLTLLAVIQVMIPDYNYRLAPMEVAVTGAGLVAGVWLRDALLFGLAFCGMLDALKDYMVPGMPYYTMQALFVLMCFGSAFLSRMRAGAQVMRSLKWAQKAIDEFNQSGSLTDLLRSLASQFQLESIAIDEPGGDGKRSVETHYLAAGAWKRQVESLHPEILARLEREGSRRFVPIEQNGSVIARLGLPGVGASSLQADETTRLRIQTCLELLLPFLARSLSQRKAARALAEFLPDGVAERLLAGQSVRQAETGYLLMVDIRDSTRIACRYGNDFWARFMRALSLDVQALARERGFSLQLVVWDALYLTRAGEPGAETIEEAARLGRELHRTIQGALRAVFGEAAARADGSPSARFCLTWGDTTRDVRSVHKADWTIVGRTLAAVSKLEQACKGAEGWLFADGSAWGGAAPAWEPLDGTVQATGERIYRLGERVPGAGAAPPAMPGVEAFVEREFSAKKAA